jgi:hypothetical protein
MRLYLDDDSANPVLVKLLRREGHDVFIPADFHLTGAKDPSHLRQAIHEQAVLLSHNYDDFKLLHDLLAEGLGRHWGILIVRSDNDPTRDMQPPHIVRAIRNMTAARVPVENEYVILNHWR